MKQGDFFNFSLKKIISPRQSVLDQARISLLYYALIFAFFAFTTCTLIMFLQSDGHNFSYLVFVGIAVNLVFLGLFKYLTWKTDWRSVSHVLLTMVTAVNLGNLYIISQQVDIVSIQLLIIAILAGFYMVGQRFGLFYSLVNVIALLAFMLMKYMHFYLVPIQPESISPSIMLTTILINFILIIFIHSHFYSAFLGNIRQLWSTG